MSFGPATFWAEGQTAPLVVLAAEEDGWLEDDGTCWRIAVDPRGVAYTHVEGPHALRLDELPEEP